MQIVSNLTNPHAFLTGSFLGVFIIEPSKRFFSIPSILCALVSLWLKKVSPCPPCLCGNPFPVSFAPSPAC